MAHIVTFTPEQSSALEDRGSNGSGHTTGTPGATSNRVHRGAGRSAYWGESKSQNVDAPGNRS
jgi:hypothetical protein